MVTFTVLADSESCASSQCRALLDQPAWALILGGLLALIVVALMTWIGALRSEGGESFAPGPTDSDRLSDVEPVGPLPGATERPGPPLIRVYIEQWPDGHDVGVAVHTDRAALTDWDNAQIEEAEREGEFHHAFGCSLIVRDVPAPEVDR